MEQSISQKKKIFLFTFKNPRLELKKELNQSPHLH